MFECKIQDTRSSFSFITDATSLVAALDKAKTVSSFGKNSEDPPRHLMVSYDSRLFIIGASYETFAVFRLPGVETENDGACQFDPERLKGLIKKRGAMEFEFENGRLAFKAVQGKYKGNVVTEEVSPEIVTVIQTRLNNSSGKQSVVTEDTMEGIRIGMKAASLKNFYNDEQIISIISVSAGRLEVSAFDNFHMSYYVAKVKAKAEFKLAIPVSVFNLIDRFIKDEGEDVSFCMDERQFLVQGTSYIINLPPIQTEAEAFGVVSGYIKSLQDPYIRLAFSGEGIKTADNMFTIANEESKMRMEVDPKGIVRLSLSNESGTIKDAFKTQVKTSSKAKVPILIDPRVFGDLFDKVRDLDEIPMYLFQKKNRGVSSSFMIKSTTDSSKLYLVGTYYED